MSNYILKYKRGEEVKYISHLDFVRFIQRVMRRAGLPMEFSSGFNPHPIMAVALPLSVGVTADGELMKIGISGEYTEEELKNIINDAFPKGFSITSVKKVSGKEIDFSKIDRARYITRCEVGDKTLPDINKFMANDKILVMKKSKSGIKEADIRPHIHELSAEVIDDEIVLKMCVDAGNNYNLKPDVVIDAMRKYIGFEPTFFNVHRVALLSGNKELM